MFPLSLHFDRLPGQFCRLLERLAGHYREHRSPSWQMGSLTGKQTGNRSSLGLARALSGRYAVNQSIEQSKWAVQFPEGSEGTGFKFSEGSEGTGFRFSECSKWAVQFSEGSEGRAVARSSRQTPKRAPISRCCRQQMTRSCSQRARVSDSVLYSDRRAVQAIGRIDRGADQNEGLNGTLV